MRKNCCNIIDDEFIELILKNRMSIDDTLATIDTYLKSFELPKIQVKNVSFDYIYALEYAILYLKDKNYTYFKESICSILDRLELNSTHGYIIFSSFISRCIEIREKQCLIENLRE